MTSAADLDVLEALAIEEARASFWAFRQRMNPKMKKGWWQRDLAHHLQQFHDDLVAGRRPRLIVQAPPQHGKSETITDFIAWASGKNPDRKTIFASFSERLGERTNGKLQRMFASERYRRTFPELVVGDGPTNGTGGPVLNRQLIEFAKRQGYFRNTTVRGSVTGESLDLGVIDDPVKGREEANSQTVRDRIWDWFTDDFATRFADDAGLLMILTRWHVDDLAGRLIERDKSVKVVSYPAIATEDSEHRREGEPLFPQLKSLDFLLKMKEQMDPVGWEALYQQSPIVAGGNLFRLEDFRKHAHGASLDLRRRVIYADTAQKTGERNDYSVFQVWGMGRDGVLYLLDQVRGKFEAPELERAARALWAREVAKTDARSGPLVAFKIEDAVSGTGLIQRLTRGEGRMPVVPIRRGRSDKYTRALDVLPSISSGMVSLPVNAPWIGDLVAELAAFPNGTHDDQVDPLVDAITDHLVSTGYDYADALSRAL
ncbi:MAG: hypothetical protein A4S16_03475 [Proteobacteria bacterium SG_bin6]|nr:MAG: hypothetical protein A4S16_03475 [Proteobacteria bacterium SG_bin6]